MFGLKVVSTTSDVVKSTLREAVTKADMTDRMKQYCVIRNGTGGLTYKCASRGGIG